MKISVLLIFLPYNYFSGRLMKGSEWEMFFKEWRMMFLPFTLIIRSTTIKVGREHHFSLNNFPILIYNKVWLNKKWEEWQASGNLMKMRVTTKGSLINWEREWDPHMQTNPPLQSLHIFSFLTVYTPSMLSLSLSLSFITLLLFLFSCFLWHLWHLSFFHLLLNDIGASSSLFFIWGQQKFMFHKVKKT